MSIGGIGWNALTERCERTGLTVRGGFLVGDGGAAPDEGLSPGTLVVLGHVGPRMWEAFALARRERRDLRLDDWTREVVAPLARDLGARAFFPFEGPPYWPFQRWAQRAEAVYPSPLGLLVHPVFGLWHGYRAALLLDDRLALPPREAAASPCERCADKPCLGACPVGAFSPARYDVDACSRHLHAEPRPECMDGGCLARRACPVGQEHIYPEAQRRFHMRAFASAERPQQAGGR